MQIAMKGKVGLAIILIILLLALDFFNDSTWASCGLDPVSDVPPNVGGEHTISYNMMPWVSWTRGCAPTSASMVLGYWDEYNGPTYGGSGRLIDYWQDLSYWPPDHVYHYGDNPNVINSVPNVLEQLRVAMNTDSDGSTYSLNIGEGITNVTNSKGYCYSSDYCWGVTTNDFCWGTITNEINFRRPFIWGSGDPTQPLGGGQFGGHFLAACGYTDNKYVMVYNTWLSDMGTDYWYYTSYDRETTAQGTPLQDSWNTVTTVVPGCQQAHNDLYLYLPPSITGYEPLTGDTIQPIYWVQYDYGITTVDLYYSTDGGVSWIFLAGNLPSYNGWNPSINNLNGGYNWHVPNINSKTVRVMAKGYDSSNPRNYIAGDGTHSDLIACPYGSTYNSSMGKCVAPISCPSGGSLNANIQRCVATPICPSGFNFNSGPQACTLTPSCPPAYYYNPGMQMCVYMNNVIAPTSSCPAGTWYDPAYNTCDMTTDSLGWCPANYMPLYDTYDDETSIETQYCGLPIGACPSGYTFSNGMCGQYAYAPLCPDGSPPVAGICTSATAFVCPAGMNYFSTRAECESNVLCPVWTSPVYSDMLCE